MVSVSNATFPPKSPPTVKLQLRYNQGPISQIVINSKANSLSFNKTIFVIWPGNNFATNIQLITVLLQTGKANDRSQSGLVKCISSGVVA